jgi:hypothetical protein
MIAVRGGGGGHEEYDSKKRWASLFTPLWYKVADWKMGSLITVFGIKGIV